MKGLNLIVYSKYAYLYIIFNQQVCLSYLTDLYYIIKNLYPFLFLFVFLFYLDNNKPDPVMYYLTKEKIYKGFLFNNFNKILEFLLILISVNYLSLYLTL